MCQINLSTAVYADCGHSKQSSFRNPECEDYRKSGKCSDEKENQMGQTRKRGECPDCLTSSTKPEEEAS